MSDLDWVKQSASLLSSMSGSNTVEVTAAPNFQDIRRARFHIVRRATNWKRSLIISIVLCAILFPTISLAYKDGSSLFWMAVIGIGFGVVLWLVLTPVMILIAYALSFLSAQTLIRSNPNLQNSTTFQFSERGYSYSGTHSQGNSLWSALLKIHETRDAFLLYPQPYLAYVIPKHCFPSQSTIEEFKNLLRASYRGQLTLLK